MPAPKHDCHDRQFLGSAIRRVRPSALLAVLAVLAPASATVAQTWATKMFDKTDHDFGVVARGSDTVYKFEVKNIYKEDVEVSSVRSSCGCTTPSIENGIIKTYDKAYVVAKFNTRTFTGVHSATLTVQISKPYPAQVQLRVHGNIRGDVVFEPGAVDFGALDQGASAEKTVSVAYAGRSGWRIDDVRSGSDHLRAELIERERYGGRVTYNLLVRLLETAPPGYLKEQLVLVTNDSVNTQVPIEVAGQVRAELSISPNDLALGDVPFGETVTKRLLVRGKKPFVITEIRCEDQRFSFDKKSDAADKQIITLRFKADREAGRVYAPIRIKTDLGDTYTAECRAYATVVGSGVAEESSSVVPQAETTRTAKTP
ncbi:DUF1573 domain-containing protein [Botrimarina hoheduenensis]|uniref:DUF1573 domain-containing protein n=1 Tax=Botrimarina hoheduenensis TaxID=2528000 RepID=A0A5C5WCB5_9BACT|nr:DUF1573 domain-containing protein [Botrimarina hoheduenensis]TWT48556.1 hypothetical protein Pla111_03290 [Botrimarina hoheduenensis]